MTMPARGANLRWSGFLLAALVAALVTLFGTGTAFAAPAAQTRARAPSVESQVVLGARGGIDADRRLGSSTSTYDSLLATGEPAENPTTAAPGLAPEYNYDIASPSYDASILFVDSHTVAQVEAVGRDATAVSVRRQSGAASEGYVAVSGFVVAANTASKFGSLSHSSSGIASFSTQRALTAGKGGSIQAHHLVERRFARQIGGNTNSWPTVVVTRSEHQVFTNAWRGAITYGSGTRTASRAQIQGAARQIYADYPEILKALGLG